MPRLSDGPMNGRHDLRNVRGSVEWHRATMTAASYRMLMSVAWVLDCGAPGTWTRPPLAERGCVVGWWSGGDSSCDIACGNQPECSAADCQLRDVLGLRENNDSVCGFITVSASMRQFSGFGPRRISKWTLPSRGQLILAEDSANLSANCEGARLDLGAVTYSKVAEDLAKGLERAHSTNTWTLVAY